MPEAVPGRNRRSPQAKTAFLVSLLVGLVCWSNCCAGLLGSGFCTSCGFWPFKDECLERYRASPSGQLSCRGHLPPLVENI